MAINAGGIIDAVVTVEGNPFGNLASSNAFLGFCCDSAMLTNLKFLGLDGRISGTIPKET
jgi:hypothetical protein